jgi:hypothetical protein
VIDAPPNQTDASGDVSTAPGRSDHDRTFGTVLGVAVSIVSLLIGSSNASLSLVALVAFFGLPISALVGSIFGPTVATAPLRWLPPLIVGIGIASAALGWVVAAVLIAGLGIVFALMTAGLSLVPAVLVVVAGLPLLVPTVIVTITMAAVWAVLLRALATVWAKAHARGRVAAAAVAFHKDDPG